MSKLIECFLNSVSISVGIAVKLRVTLELVLVENCVGEVGLNQNVNVEVYEGEKALREGRRGVDVAVKLEQLAAGRLKAEDAVPAIRPEDLCAQSPRLDGSDEIVLYLLREEG